MARIPPPVAAVRLAVRRSLAELPRGSVVVVACSGGADSLALAAAVGFLAPRLGLSAGLVTVDHRLQDGSAERAAAVAQWGTEAGFVPSEVATVDVTGLPGGPEAAARTARYAALGEAAARRGAAAVLLGHTREDQAETVLLALARGAGPRGLAGMPYRKGVLVRPLLDVSRADARKACAALGLPVWEDPHNTDPAYARSRVRAGALPALIAALGPAVVENLARTAAQLAADNATLDGLAATALAQARGARGHTPAGAGPAEGERDAGNQAESPGNQAESPGPALGGQDAGLAVAALADLPPALRTRVLHAWAKELGAAGGALSHHHVQALDVLITDWHGQGPTTLPGGITVARRSGYLVRVSG